MNETWQREEVRIRRERQADSAGIIEHMRSIRSLHRCEGEPDDPAGVGVLDAMAHVYFGCRA